MMKVYALELSTMEGNPYVLYGLFATQELAEAAVPLMMKHRVPSASHRIREIGVIDQ
jgi:hypothetical protein